MDYLESLGKQLSEVTVYDLKSVYNQAKNMVMNYTEMEAKVREATNDDAWGASSTLMKEIADGTQNFQLFNEIMPTIYKRFTEKEASEWRQIYKALQLLEYLVKHGSERVVDDARQHVSMIKMLRNFHYTDEKGKDQGINVRNRAKELAELLGDLERVRQERKKARANKSKYGGISSEGRLGAGGSRYGGFGSDSPGYEGNASPSFGGNNRSSFRDTAPRRESFEEYDAGDWDDRASGPSTRKSTQIQAKPVPEAPKPEPKKEVNLFDWDDEPVPAPASNAPAASASLDDDFDDFQSAVPVANNQPIPTAKPAATSAKPNFFDMMNSGPSHTSAVPLQKPVSTANYAQSTPFTPASNLSSASKLSSAVTPNQAPSKPKGAFDDLWEIAGASTKPSAMRPSGNSMADLAKQKTTSQIWASSNTTSSQNNQFDDNLLL